MSTSRKKHTFDFEFRQLEIFCKVVELASFSKAAEAVNLTQPSVSERMANLEETVGAKLVEVINRQVSLTSAGRFLYPRALRCLALRRQIGRELTEFFEVRHGDLEIGASTIPGEYILPGLIRAFRQAFPEVTVRLRIADSDEISRKVSEGEIELGIVGSKTRVRGLIFRELWKDQLVVVVPAEHPWAHKKLVSLEELFSEPFIARETGSGTRRLIEQYLSTKHLRKLNEFNIVARLGSSSAIKEGVKQGLGVSIISGRAVQTEVKAGALKIVQVEGFPLERKFYLIRDRRRSLSRLGRALSEFLERES